MITKVCTRCGVEKNLTEFHSQKTGKYGKTSKCKYCKSEQAKDWAIRNPHKKRDNSNRYRLAHPDRVRERLKKWRNKNRDHVKEYEKQYKVKNTEKVKAWKRNDYTRHKKERVESANRWKYHNLSKYSEIQKMSKRQRRERLSDSYLKDKLKEKSVPVDENTMYLQKTSILIRRAIKKIENETNKH